MDTTPNIAKTLLDELRDGMKPQELVMPKDGDDLCSPVIIGLPSDLKHHDFTDRIRQTAQTLKPLRRNGTAKLDDLDSLIAWTNRHKGEASALFATLSPPALTAIIDYPAAGAPQTDHNLADTAAAWSRHRATYQFPLSEEWKKWMAVSGKDLDGPAMGEFIETRAADLLDPTPFLLGQTQKAPQDWEIRMAELAAKLDGRFGQYLTLVRLAKEFNIHENSTLQASTNRDTGETSIQFVDQHQQPDGRPLQVPNLFMIAIPVFDGGALYRLPVRFRYRKAGSAVKFILSVYNADDAARAATTEALDRVHAETFLPVFLGTPETPQAI